MSNILKLSDSYIHGKEIPLELIVKIITSDNQEQNILLEYISFCQKYDSLKEGLQTKEEILKALRTTIQYCKNHDILKEFLETKEREVEEIMMSVFTQEQATDMILKEKYNEGKLEGIEAVAKSLRDSGTSMDIIVKCTGLTELQIMQL